MRFNARFWSVYRRFGACGGRSGPGPRALRRSSEVPVGPDGPVCRRGGLDGRQAGVRAIAAGARCLAGQAGRIRRQPARCDDGLGAGQPPGRAPLRLRLPVVRPGHPCRPQHADAAGDVPGLQPVPVDHFVHASGDPGHRAGEDRRVPRGGTAAAPVPDVLRRHPPRRAAHAEPGRRESLRPHGRARCHGQHGAIGVPQRGHAVPRDHAVERREGAARRGGL